MRTHRAVSLAVIVGVTTGAVGLPRASAAMFPPGLTAETEAFDYTLGPFSGTSDSDPGSVMGPFVVSESIAAREGSTSRSVARAAYGFLSVRTSTIGRYSSVTSDTSIGQAVADASFVDNEVVVLREGIATGMPGSFRARFNVDRVIAFSAALVEALDEGTVVLEGGYSLGIVIGETVSEIDGSALGGTWRRVGVGGPLEEPEILPPGIVELDVEFQYGVAFTIAVEVSVNLFTSITDGGTVDVDSELLLGPSFRWLGIVDGIDEETTVSSPSVADWTKPAVPSPGTGSALALLVMGTARRRR